MISVVNNIRYAKTNPLLFPKTEFSLSDAVLVTSSGLGAVDRRSERVWLQAVTEGHFGFFFRPGFPGG